MTSRCPCVRRSNQLCYEATDVGSWSFMGSNEPVRNQCWSYIWNISNIQLRMWNQVSYDPRSYESNLCNCLYGSLKKSGLQRGLNPWPRDTSVIYGIALKSWIFQPFYIRNCINCVNNCDGHSLITWYPKHVIKVEICKRVFFLCFVQFELSHNLPLPTGRSLCNTKFIHYLRVNSRKLR